MRARIRLYGAVLVLAALIVSGCQSFVRPGEMRTEEQTVELQGAESADVRVAMGAGQLNLSGGAAELMDAQFTYNVDRWEPQISYEVDGNRGVLSVTQPSEVSIPEPSSVEYTWDIQLSDAVPVDLDVSLGAGEGNLDLSSVALSSLDVEMGAGQAIIILTGDYDESFDAHIRGGVGSATLMLSRDVGARVEVSGGLGSLNVTGFNEDGNVYTNDAYETSDVTINIRMEGGVGEITLQLVD